MKNCFKVLLVFVTLIIAGCSDPCDDVNCNNGVCIEGTCDCDEGWGGPNCDVDLCADCVNGDCTTGTCNCNEGYEGENCDVLVNEKYFGLYTVTEVDCGDGVTSNLETMTIAAKDGGSPTDVTLTLTSPEAESFDATLVDGQLNGSGSIQGFTVLVSGTVSDTGSFEGSIGVVGFFSCDYTMIKE